jgi:hypothetical protein
VARARGGLRLGAVLLLALGMGACGPKAGAVGGGAGGEGGEGGARPEGVGRVTADGVKLPPKSDVRPRPSLVLDVDGALEARHVVAALRRASDEGFATFRLRVSGHDAGPPFGFEVVRAEADSPDAPASPLPPPPPAPPPAAGLGPRDAGAVASTIRAGLPEVKDCFEKALRRDPRLAGKVTVRVAIAPSGAVASVGFDASSIADASFLACVKARIAAWRFGPAGEDSEVVYPLVFAPSGSDEPRPIAVVIGGRTIAVTDERGEEHAFHAAGGVALSTDEARRVILEATIAPERAPRADVLPRDGVRTAMLDQILRWLETEALELRVVEMETSPAPAATPR